MNYANIKFNDIANGEGVRTSLFVSGCTHHCKYCFNPETWDFNYGKEFTLEVQDKIIASLAPSHISGLTLLGGEPMEPANQKGLLEFVKRVKATYPNKTIWCYTGCILNERKGILTDKHKNTSVTKALISLIDVLVDGPFIEELKDVRLKFRGSSNQRVIDVKKTLQSRKIVLYLE